MKLEPKSSLRKVCYTTPRNYVKALKLFLNPSENSGEQKASRALREASEIIGDSPAALQLRYLQVNIN